MHSRVRAGELIDDSVCENQILCLGGVAYSVAKGIQAIAHVFKCILAIAYFVANHLAIAPSMTKLWRSLLHSIISSDRPYGDGAALLAKTLVLTGGKGLLSAFLPYR